MKNLLLILIFFLFASGQLNAQAPTDKCGTMQYLQEQIKSNPGLENKILIYDAQIQQFLKQNISSATNSVITIPVVVHIIYNADSQNISNQRIFDQIAITNRDFAGLNYHSMGAFSSTLKADVGVQFCLAQKKPDGSATNGIERRQTTVTSFIHDDAAKYYNSGGMDAWDPTRYLNIWVCNYVMVDTAGYIFSAYAQFPGAGINATYGVLIRYGAMGPTDSTYYRGNGGVLTHELGHCLNLRHIWGDDNVACSGTDFCGDSPNQGGRTTGVHSGLLTDNCSTSSPGIMYMNFMDYSNDIVFANFTPNQATRMLANFAVPNGVLIPLANSDACSTPTAGIKESGFFGKVHLFPNPAKEQVTINYNIGNVQNAEINLRDIPGRIIISEKLTSKQGENKFILYLNEVSKGFYFVELTINEQKRIVRKLIVE